MNLSSMKNEEDVYRFLYYHNAAHPQLMQDIILNVFEQRPVLTYESLPVDVSAFMNYSFSER